MTFTFLLARNMSYLALICCECVWNTVLSSLSSVNSVNCQSQPQPGGKVHIFVLSNEWCVSEQEVEKHLLSTLSSLTFILLTVREQWKSMHSPASCMCATAVFLCFQWSDRVLDRDLRCPNYVQQSLVSPSLGYHLKMEVWYLNWACIMIKAHNEDMECNDSVRAVTDFIYRFW